MGMIRGMLDESCRPDWDFATRLCSDLQSLLDEDTLLLLELSMVRSSCCECPVCNRYE